MLSAFIHTKAFPVVVATLLTGLFYILTQQVYSLRFSYGDDYRLAVMHNPQAVPKEYIKASKDIVLDVPGSIRYDYAQGRFRPLSWVWAKMQTQLFGTNTRGYRLFNLLILFLSVWFFYCILRVLRLDIVSSVLVTMMFIFGKNAETWWLLIPPAQNIGELCLLAAVFFFSQYTLQMKQASYVAGIIFLLLASLIKESFALIAPFIPMFFYYLSGAKALRVSFKRAAVMAVFPLTTAALFVLSNGRIYGYENPGDVKTVFWYNLIQTGTALYFFLAPLIVLGIELIRNTNRIGKYSALLLLLCIVILTQLILLHRIKMEDQHHYLMPLILLPLFLTGLSLKQLREHNKTGAYVLILVYTCMLLNNVKNVYINSSYCAAKTTCFYEMLDFMKTKPVRHVIYVNRTPCNNDWLCGTSVILHKQDSSLRLFHFPVSCPESNTSSYATVNETQLNALKPLWVLFELPDEKGVEHYPLKQEGENLYLYSGTSKTLFKGNLHCFTKKYDDWRTGELLTMNSDAWHREAEVRYKAIYMN